MGNLKALINSKLLSFANYWSKFCYRKKPAILTYNKIFCISFCNKTLSLCLFLVIDSTIVEPIIDTRLNTKIVGAINNLSLIYNELE